MSTQKLRTPSKENKSSTKKLKSRIRAKLLVPVEHDDVERFHYPGETGELFCESDGRIRLKIGHDTLLVNNKEIEMTDS